VEVNHGAGTTRGVRAAGVKSLKVGGGFAAPFVGADSDGPAILRPSSPNETLSSTQDISVLTRNPAD
jgi:hypothetical protein